MLPKSHRIPSPELRAVSRQGKRIVSNSLELKFFATSNDAFRCAIVVPIKFDKRATARNRVRRLISESVRLMLPSLRGGVDGVFFVRGRLPDTQQDVQKIVYDVLEKAGVLT